MTIILYCRRNTGLCALSYFVAAGHKVKVITDDVDIIVLAYDLGVPIIDENTMGEYDLIVSVHWNKIIKDVYLAGKKSFNVHPCLFKYKGKDPIARYIKNKDIVGSVAAHRMTSVVDEGEVLCEWKFYTGIVEGYAEFYNLALPYYFKTFDLAMKKL